MRAKNWRIPATTAIVAVTIAAGGLAWWQPWAPDVEPAAIDKMAFVLPDKPSIAVLPFDNLSADKEQQYFADGLTEYFIAGLASFPNLFVIAHGSTRKLEGKAVEIRDVAHDLGVRYVIEGGVRRSDDMVRITARLTDALSGNHIWAESYDRKLENLFALRDEITGEIGARLVGKADRRSRKDAPNTEAYDLLLRARKVESSGLGPRRNARAIRLYEQAIEKDPEYARAHAYLAFARCNNVVFRWATGPKDTLKHALEMARKAVALDPRDGETYRILGRVHQARRQFDQAIVAMEKATALSPNNTPALTNLAHLLAFAGRAEDAVKYAERAMRLDPLGPRSHLLSAGAAYYMAKRFDKAAAAFKRARQLDPRTDVSRHNSAAAHARSSRMAEARTARVAFLKVRPGFSIEGWKRRTNLKGGFKELVVEGLYKAGFPENPPLKISSSPSTRKSDGMALEYFSNGITEDIMPSAALLLPAAAALAAGQQSATPLTVAFIGDQGITDDSRAVLRLIKQQGADMVLHQGDFDYDHDPDAWDAMINDILGEDFPYFASIGNHDRRAWPGPGGYQAKLRARLARIQGARCSGDLGVRSACSYRGLFFILSGIGTKPKDSDDEPRHVAYIKDQLAKTDAAWRVCSWHKNQADMQLGGKDDDVGWQAYEACREGGAIVATAHEHSYSRTRLMNHFESQSVVSQSNILVLEKGKSFAFVSGLGGKSIRDQERDGDWWAVRYAEDQGADHGALFCTFNANGEADRAYCYFRDIRGRVPDRFEIINAVKRPRQVSERKSR